jgi:hypothetical protein
LVCHGEFLIKALLVRGLERIFSFFPSLSATPRELIQHSDFRAAFGGMLLEWAMVEQDAGGLAREERRWDGLPARESPNNVPMPFTNVATAGFPKDSIRGSAGCADLIGRIMMPHTPP